MRLCGYVGLLGIAGACVGGCQRAAPPQWASSQEVLALPEKLQEQIRSELTKACGTPSSPKLIGNPQASVHHLRHGAAIYQDRCAACHGTSGDGAGVAARHLDPKPRDYRRGIFKFTSTPYGAKPRREDLVRTVRQGARGTSMPSFALLAEEDLQAVIDYVLVLTHRGELELQLAIEGENEDEIDAGAVPEKIAAIEARWAAARGQVVRPLTHMPEYSEATVEAGKKAFLSETAGCFKCHGPDGRGQVTDNVKGFTDAWGVQTRAADLTSGMFHGGQDPVDIYRRIFAGINGTPMPSFQAKLAEQPETFWHLVHYVQHVAGARRRETLKQQAAFGPQPSAKAAPEAGP